MTTPPPAWAHLEPASLKALLEPAGRLPQALRLTPYDVPVEAALQVPMVHAARLLLSLAVEKNGLALTPARALKRVDVWHVFDQTEWPGLDGSRIGHIKVILGGFRMMAMEELKKEMPDLAQELLKGQIARARALVQQPK